VRGVFNSIKEAISGPMNRAKEIVSSALSKIRSLLSGTLKFPHIKLPHIKIAGKLSLNPPQVPKIGVDWYARGGIFDRPTIAGIGESGPEAVVPLDKLWDKLDRIADASGESVTINVYARPGMNINQLTSKIEQVLINRQRQRQMAWGR